MTYTYAVKIFDMRLKVDGFHNQEHNQKENQIFLGGKVLLNKKNTHQLTIYISRIEKSSYSNLTTISNPSQ